MRTSIALASVVAAAALAVPSAALAQRAPPPPPAYADQYAIRSPWYVGFGIGSGNGFYNFQGDRVNYRHHGAGSPFQLALQLEAGATLTPRLLLGGELSGLVSSSSQAGVDYTLTVGQLLAVLTYFPAETGFFLRGGAGIAQISSEQSGGDVVYDAFGFPYTTTMRDSATGVGLLGGAGYAWWLGRRFNLTLHGDVNFHAYSGNRDAPSSSTTFTGYLGFRWY